MSFIVKNLADRITINLRFFLERAAIYLIFIYKDEMSTDPKNFCMTGFFKSCYHFYKLCYNSKDMGAKTIALPKNKPALLNRLVSTACASSFVVLLF
ncbi:MAG: hypothetical protein Q4G13_01805 [Moraxella sp.]|nr:hypothetical protein [Moraxella sp.]